MAYVSYGSSSFEEVGICHLVDGVRVRSAVKGLGCRV